MLKSTELHKISIEQQLLSKAAIKLPPKERLSLLLRAKRYPIVTKKSATERQIREMIDFYNLCCLMLKNFVTNEHAANNFFALNFLVAQENHEVVNEELLKDFKLLEGYEELERRITSIQSLFYQYHSSFPDVYQKYNLEQFAFEKITDILENPRQMLIDSISIKKLLNRWELS